jgi:site-specific recombinase XerD
MSIIKDSTTIADACIAWLAANPHLSPHTRIAYQGEIDRLGQYAAARFSVLAVSELSPTHWEKYLRGMARSRKSVNTRRSEVLKPSSLLQAMRISRQFLIWCGRTELLAWWPPKVKLPTLLQARTPRTIARELPQALRLVLIGESSTGKSPHELRAVLAMNLAYWGALDVGDLAALKVQNLVRRGSMTLLAVSGREVHLPDHVRSLWHRYRTVREVELGARLAPNASLLASLGAQAPLRPWSVWAMVKKWQEEQQVEPAFSPRVLRAAFVQSAQNHEAAGLAASVAHAGVVVARVAAATGDIGAQIRRIQGEELRRLAA